MYWQKKADCFFAFAPVFGIIIAALLILPLQIGIWFPDVIIARRHTLAEQQLTSGYRLRVVQYWNRCDFYSTELHVTSPDGRTEVHTLDGDDNKSWRLPLTVDEQHRTVSVTLGGSRVRTIHW